MQAGERQPQGTNAHPENGVKIKAKLFNVQLTSNMGISTAPFGEEGIQQVTGGLTVGALTSQPTMSRTTLLCILGIFNVRWAP